MSKFEVTVYDEFFDQEFTAEILTADTEEQAKILALEIYAQELDTDIESLEVKSVKSI